MTSIAAPRERPASGQFTSTEIDLIFALNSLEVTPPGFAVVKTKEGFANIPINGYVSDRERATA